MSVIAPLILVLFAVRVSSRFSNPMRIRSDLARFLARPRSSGINCALDDCRYSETEKEDALHVLRTTIQEIGVNVTEHAFFVHDTDEIGRNLLVVFNGPHYGTSDDRVVVVGANYDTLANHSGVDDNGSGVAGLLEIIRFIHLYRPKYKHRNSLIIVFFDSKTSGMSGSRAFVSDVLLPLVGRSKSQVVGVLILDGILHYDPFPTSQALPPDFEKNFPHQHYELHEHLFMGDFVQIVGREELDADLATRGNFELCSEDRQWRVSTPWLLAIALPLRGISLFSQIYTYRDFLLSDHASFMFHSTDDNDVISMPTIYITDTLKNRGVLQYCPHCDNVKLLTDENLHFLSLIVDTAIKTVVDLLQFSDDCPSMIDCPQTTFATLCLNMRLKKQYSTRKKKAHGESSRFGD